MIGECLLPVGTLIQLADLSFRRFFTVFYIKYSETAVFLLFF
jgi:hypothetical protein